MSTPALTTPVEVLGQVKYTRLSQLGIGEGRNSEVWRANDIHLGGVFAVKEISRALLRAQGFTDYFSEAKAMFAASHPSNVVPICYACDCPGEDKIGLVMPYYRNGSLQRRITNGPLSVLEVRDIGLAMLNGLNQIHLAGYFHFDLKPSNILFSNSGTPMVADFGQTKMFGPTGTVAFPRMYPGGPPPEFYIDGIGSHETDIYHAGLTLYRAVNGQPYFEKQLPASDMEMETRTKDGTFPRRDWFLPHVPSRLRQVIRKAMMVTRTERYPSATDLQDALAGVSVTLNWKIEQLSNGMVWKAERPGQPTWIVEMMQTSTSQWAVKLFGENSGKRRKLQTSNWLPSATSADAMRHLKQLFRSWE